jgi:hypothetical protein
MTPATLTSVTATKNAKAMPAPQPQAIVIAIHSASTAAMITPRPDTTLGSVSFAGALRQSNRTLEVSVGSDADATHRADRRRGLPPELVGLSRFAGTTCCWVAFDGSTSGLACAEGMTALRAAVTRKAANPGLISVSMMERVLDALQLFLQHVECFSVER